MIVKLFLLGLLIILLGSALYAHGNWNPLSQNTTIDRILIEKAARKMSIFRDGQKLKTYRIALGPNPVGHKQQEGDMRTPEGVYTINGRNPDSDYHLSLRISYPSDADNASAAARGVPPGFDIMIHGIANGRGWIGAFHRRKDWTAGCIAVTDTEMDEIWRATPDGTTVEIRP